MPWCENCEKSELKKDEVVFDERRKRILCVPCGQAQSEPDDEVELKMEVFDKLWYGVSYESDRGLKAEAIYGGTKLTVDVSNAQIKRLLGR